MDPQTEGGNIPNQRYTSGVRRTVSTRHNSVVPNPYNTNIRALPLGSPQPCSSISSLSNAPTAPLGLQPYKSTPSLGCQQDRLPSQKQLSWVGVWAFTVQKSLSSGRQVGCFWFKYSRPARPLQRSVAGKVTPTDAGVWLENTTEKGGPPPRGASTQGATPPNAVTPLQSARLEAHRALPLP